MTNARPYKSKSGGIPVLYRLAVASEPKTPAELADELDASADAVGTAATRLYRSGYVERRARDDGGKTKPPYEYVVSPPTGFETHDGEGGEA